jgi:hypothetical protein
MRIQSTQSRSHVQKRAEPQTQKAEATPNEPRDQVTFADRARSGLKYGLASSAVCAGGFLGFTAIERAFGFHAGLAEMALPLALSMAGGGAVGVSFGMLVGADE